MRTTINYAYNMHNWIHSFMRTWIIEETGLETIGHVQCIVHADWLRAFFNMVEPSGNL